MGLPVGPLLRRFPRGGEASCAAAGAPAAKATARGIRVSSFFMVWSPLSLIKGLVFFSCAVIVTTGSFSVHSILDLARVALLALQNAFALGQLDKDG